MSWHPSDKEVTAVLDLDAAARYEYWIKKVADTEEVWSLWQDNGWAFAADDTGRRLMPVWPHEAYAVLCATGEWEGYEPKAISLNAWLERWIRGMERDDVLAAVFPTPSNQGVPVVPRRLEHDLRQEVSKYE